MSIPTTGQSPSAAADSPNSSASASAQAPPPPPATNTSPSASPPSNNPLPAIPVTIPEHIHTNPYHVPLQQPNANQGQGIQSNTSPYNIQSNNQSAAAAAAAANARRKPSRRANTAERRATHNAVERQRRETLNGRFLDLAALLPNLASVRRPSKSAIVNSSIALIHTQRRMRIIAGREFRALKAEADELRHEVAQWRERSGMPRGPLPEEIPRSREFVEILGTEEMDDSWEGWDGIGIDEGMMEGEDDMGEDDGEEEMLQQQHQQQQHHAAQVQAQQHAAALHHQQQQAQLHHAQQQQQQHHHQAPRHPYEAIYDPSAVAAAAYHQQQQQAHAHAHQQQQQLTPPHSQHGLAAHHPLTLGGPNSPIGPDPVAAAAKMGWNSHMYTALGLPHGAVPSAPPPAPPPIQTQWAHAAQAAHSALFTPPSTAGGAGHVAPPPNPFETSANQAFLANYQRATAHAHAQAQHQAELASMHEFNNSHARGAHPSAAAAAAAMHSLHAHQASQNMGALFPHGFGPGAGGEDDAESVGSGGHDSVHSGHLGGYGGHVGGPGSVGAGSPGSDGSAGSGTSGGHVGPQGTGGSYEATNVDGGMAMGLLNMGAAGMNANEYPRRPAGVAIPSGWSMPQQQSNVTPPGAGTPPATARGNRSPIAVGGGASMAKVAVTGPQFAAMSLLI